MVQIFNGIWNLVSQPFEIQTNGHHFVRNHLKSGQKHSDFEWSGFWMVETLAIDISKAWPFENRTILNPALKKSGFLMVRFQISSVGDLKKIVVFYYLAVGSKKIISERFFLEKVNTTWWVWLFFKTQAKKTPYF